MKSIYTGARCRLMYSIAILGVTFSIPPHVLADDPAEVEALKKQVQGLQETVQQLQDAILKMQQETTARDERIQQQVEAVRKQQADAFATRIDSPLDKAIQESEAEGSQPLLASRPEGLWSRSLGGGTRLRLIDISADVLFYAGGSSKRDEALSTLQGGAHDPNKRGFTLGQAELSFSGAVDPYFRGETHLISSIDPVEGETVVELEEAFLTTTSLPYNLELEVGHFFTEFGQINPQHPHQWDWVDQPVINSRLFGGDGMRQTGFRLSALLPTPWYSSFHFGMQNANGETMPSFLGGELGGHGHGEEEEPDAGHAHEGGEEDLAEVLEEFGDPGIGGRPVIEQDVRGFGDFAYLVRWTNSWDLSDSISGVVGFSGMYGPNATGRDGNTYLYGLDMKWRWNPLGNFRGYPFLTWQTEVMRRDLHAARFEGVDPDGDLITVPGRTLQDWGLYTQALYGFSYGWAAGVRYEYAGGNGVSIGGRQNDPFRDDRHRLAPLLVWRPSEFSRLRLQYNFDHASHLSGSAHSVWLGFEWLYGSHAAHSF